MKSSDFWWKIGHLVVPFVMAAVVFPFAYAGAEWLLLDKVGLKLDEDAVKYWAAIGFASLVVAVVIYPGLRRLRLSEKNNIPFLYAILAMVGVAVPLIFARSVVSDLVDRPQHLAVLADAARGTPALYYTTDQACWRRESAKAYAKLERDDRSNRPTYFKIFIAAPVCTTTGKPAPVWIGLHYTRDVDGASTDAELQAKYEPFARETDDAFAKEDRLDFRYFERLRPSADLRDFRKAIAEAGHDPEKAIVLVPHRQELVQDVSTDLRWFAAAVGIGSLGWLLLVLLPGIDEEKRAKPSHKEDGAGSAAMLFLPRASNYGAPLLLDVNIGVFLAMVFSGLGVVAFDIPDLIAWGGNYGPLDHGWGLLRLISCQFVHGGLMHLANNLYGLVLATVLLMPIITNWRLIAAYLTCGLGGSIASVVVHPTIVSIGASGAIMGLWGILLVLCLLRDKRMGDARKPILTNVAIFTAITLLLGSLVPGIDNAAHIGGLTVGLVLGLLLLRRDGRKA